MKKKILKKVSKSLNTKTRKLKKSRSVKKHVKFDKKALFLTLTGLVIVVGVVIFFASSNYGIILNNKTPDTADSLKLQAIKIMRVQPNDAKRLLNESKQKYIADNNKNGIVDIESLLYLLDHTANK